MTGWRKASHSHGNIDGQCVEVGDGPAVVGVRDTQDRGGPVLEFSPQAWAAFTAAVKRAP
jgi:hypothetical protein